MQVDPEGGIRSGDAGGKVDSAQQRQQEPGPRAEGQGSTVGRGQVVKLDCSSPSSSFGPCQLSDLGRLPNLSQPLCPHLL